MAWVYTVCSVLPVRILGINTVYVQRANIDYVRILCLQEKRLKKDAGRQRWSPYLRQLKKNGDPDNSLSADERSDDGMTDYHGNVFLFSH